MLQNNACSEQVNASLQLQECSKILGCAAAKCSNFDYEGGACGPVLFMALLNTQAFLAVIVNAMHIIILKRTQNLLQSNLGISVFG